MLREVKIPAGNGYLAGWIGAYIGSVAGALLGGAIAIGAFFVMLVSLQQDDHGFGGLVLPVVAALTVPLGSLLGASTGTYLALRWGEHRRAAASAILMVPIAALVVWGTVATTDTTDTTGGDTVLGWPLLVLPVVAPLSRLLALAVPTRLRPTFTGDF
jgi:hypothetical protein